MMSDHIASFEPPGFDAVWKRLEAQFRDPKELQKSRPTMRTLMQGHKTIIQYVYQYRNLQIRLIGVQEDELQDDFVLGICLEMK